MDTTAPREVRTRLRFLIPVILLAVVGTLGANAFLADPRTPATPLGASTRFDGGLARIQGVIPTETDGWTPPVALPALTDVPGGNLHRVRVLLELTAIEQDGMSFDPSQFVISTLGEQTWNAVWASPDAETVRQGQIIDAELVFELPDQAVDLTLDVPGGTGLSLGKGHHLGGE